MRRIILPALLIFSFGLIVFGCQGEEKVCRCMVKSNVDDWPDPLFDIIYIDEEEDCDDYSDTETVFPQDATPGDTTVNPTVWRTTCRERFEAFPED